MRVGETGDSCPHLALRMDESGIWWDNKERDRGFTVQMCGRNLALKRDSREIHENVPQKQKARHLGEK